MNDYPRAAEGDLGGGASAGKVRLLFGARQTGKTTLLRRLADSTTVPFDLQDRRTRLDFERDPHALVRILEATTARRTAVCIDEIQRVPALLDEVQYLHDRHPRRFEFLLTGSSARRLKTAAANLLPGRAHLYHLSPLILPERRDCGECRILPVSVGRSFAAGFPRPRLDDLLLYGSLPGVTLEPEETRVRTLESYVELYLEEEIRREALVRNVGAFQQFLELAALESGGIVNLTNLSRESGVPVATIRTFYQVLEDTFIGYRIPAFGGAGRKRVLTTPRFLFFDTGVRNAAARLHPGPDLLATQRGVLLENWVGQELIHRCRNAGRAHRVSFWRTVHGAEVDFVLETPSEVVPIEVKATERPSESDAAHIRLFMATYPRRVRRGYVVCRCRAPQRLAEGVEAIPWNLI